MKMTAPLVFRLIAVLALALGTMQIAYAKGQDSPVGEMVLCTGQGAITVAVDASGKPTGGLRYCPKCAATALQAVEVPPAGIPARHSVVSEILAPVAQTPFQQRIAMAQRARSPPVSV